MKERYASYKASRDPAGAAQLAVCNTLASSRGAALYDAVI